MLNFMIMSLQQLATTCKALLFYFIAARPYNCNKIFHASYFIIKIMRSLVYLTSADILNNIYGWIFIFH